MRDDDKDLELVDEELEDLDDDEVEEYVGGPGGIGFVLGFVLGALIGAGVALLTAPDRGIVVRRKIRTRLGDLQDDAREQLGDLRDEARREVRKQRRRIQQRLRRHRN